MAMAMNLMKEKKRWTMQGLLMMMMMMMETPRMTMWRLTLTTWVLRVYVSDKLHLMIRSVPGRLTRALVGTGDIARIYKLKCIKFMSTFIQGNKKVYTPL